jgi:isoamyl acetate esterase
MKKMKKVLATTVTAAMVSAAMISPVSAATGDKEVVTFGDSNTALVMHSPLDTWAGKLGITYEVINSGFPGYTSEDALSLFRSDVLNYAPTDVTIMFGTNDAVMVGPGDPQVEKSEFRANLEHYVRTLQAWGIEPILMTSLPIIKSQYYERHNQDYYASVGGAHAWHNSYNEIVRNVSEDMNVTLVDNYKNIMDKIGGTYNDEALKSSGLIQDDGTHLTVLGSDIIYDELKDVMKVGTRQSLSSGGTYTTGDTMHIYTITGDASNGTIDNSPYVGVNVTYKIMRDMGGYYQRYKTIYTTTDYRGYANASQTLTSSFPKGDYKLYTTIEANGEIIKLAKPFSIN